MIFFLFVGTLAFGIGKVVSGSQSDSDTTDFLVWFALHPRKHVWECNKYVCADL